MVFLTNNTPLYLHRVTLTLCTNSIALNVSFHFSKNSRKQIVPFYKPILLYCQSTKCLSTLLAEKIFVGGELNGHLRSEYNGYKSLRRGYDLG